MSRLLLCKSLTTSLGSVLVEISLTHDVVVGRLGCFGNVVDALDPKLGDLAPADVRETAEGYENVLLGLVLAEAVDGDDLG